MAHLLQMNLLQHQQNVHANSMFLLQNTKNLLGSDPKSGFFHVMCVFKGSPVLFYG